MYVNAGWLATPGIRGLKSFESLCDGFRRDAKAKQPTSNSRTQTRQTIAKQRAQLARANRQEQ